MYLPTLRSHFGSSSTAWQVKPCFSSQCEPDTGSNRSTPSLLLCPSTPCRHRVLAAEASKMQSESPTRSKTATVAQPGPPRVARPLEDDSSPPPAMAPAALRPRRSPTSASVQQRGADTSATVILPARRRPTTHSARGYPSTHRRRQAQVHRRREHHTSTTTSTYPAFTTQRSGIYGPPQGAPPPPPLPPHRVCLRSPLLRRRVSRLLLQTLRSSL